MISSDPTDYMEKFNEELLLLRFVVYKQRNSHRRTGHLLGLQKTLKVCETFSKNPNKFTLKEINKWTRITACKLSGLIIHSHFLNYSLMAFALLSRIVRYSHRALADMLHAGNTDAKLKKPMSDAQRTEERGIRGLMSDYDEEVDGLDRSFFMDEGINADEELEEQLMMPDEMDISTLISDRLSEIRQLTHKDDEDDGEEIDRTAFLNNHIDSDAESMVSWSELIRAPRDVVDQSSAQGVNGSVDHSSVHGVNGSVDHSSIQGINGSAGPEQPEDGRTVKSISTTNAPVVEGSVVGDSEETVHDAGGGAADSVEVIVADAPMVSQRAPIRLTPRVPAEVQPLEQPDNSPLDPVPENVSVPEGPGADVSTTTVPENPDSPTDNPTNQPTDADSESSLFPRTPPRSPRTPTSNQNNNNNDDDNTDDDDELSEIEEDDAFANDEQSSEHGQDTEEGMLGDLIDQMGYVSDEMSDMEWWDDEELLKRKDSDINKKKRVRNIDHDIFGTIGSHKKKRRIDGTQAATVIMNRDGTINGTAPSDTRVISGIVQSTTGNGSDQGTDVSPGTTGGSNEASKDGEVTVGDASTDNREGPTTVDAYGPASTIDTVVPSNPSASNNREVLTSSNGVQEISTVSLDMIPTTSAHQNNVGTSTPITQDESVTSSTAPSSLSTPITPITKRKKKKRKKSNVNEPTSSESSVSVDPMIELNDPSEGASEPKRRRLNESNNDDPSEGSSEKLLQQSNYKEKELLEKDDDGKIGSSEISVSATESSTLKRDGTGTEETLPADGHQSNETTEDATDSNRSADSNRATSAGFRPLFKRSPLYRMQRVAVIEKD